ncbi:ferric-dicitrate binding protein FerR (iron transport regulator) [Parabacteroides sp. PF5-5]|uniref:FecR family protein n=1 Tax=unclassified Parabacteroides TaxID=2649774 RepID=UPI0024732F5F|nr:MULTISPECIES: FecR domain-containing protein [unclassified Parabacteroides]MDH6305775.1 ferric-dicitrate binding protein FerR (iron transport regulator) [Parabacteroides sp. PH5-39]MDH6317788.1 ferric-dicitrate binding protein FerR (iron transport regulator) [Parabacteroides sp. PF5-13]MDH6320619.1 ferric-dicitrate binding protein FerR (iron transport regulator) [Parabacteroides sp. PH5-13]MDH6324218.1 ferric-dicitrate binding protein FerR (iron transport regulator) [Parabacteroides sp. PH5-
MTKKEHNTVDTNQAWHQLYARLEQDGLIPDKARAKQTRLFRQAATRWAAAIALLCICTATFLFLRNQQAGTNPNLLTLKNEKGALTLVTTLEDGSIIYLGDDTQIQYPEHFNQDKREVALEGNARFDVAGNRERPFLIETQDIQIEVIGTAFNVQSTDHLPFELSVQRGEVKVTYKKNNKSIHVKAGETVRLSSSQWLLEETMDDLTFADYTRRMRFKDERLADILRVINNESLGSMLQTTPSLEDRRLTVSFDNNSPETMAELICTAFKLKYKKENNVLLISEP